MERFAFKGAEHMRFLKSLLDVHRFCLPYGDEARGEL